MTLVFLKQVVYDEGPFELMPRSILPTNVGKVIEVMADQVDVNAELCMYPSSGV